MPKKAESTHRRLFERATQRMSCELNADGRWHPAIVLNLSARGLFVQTSLNLPVGAETLLRLRCDPGGPAELAAKVTRAVRPHRDVATLTKPGLGLEICAADESYFHLLIGLSDLY